MDICILYTFYGPKKAIHQFQQGHMVRETILLVRKCLKCNLSEAYLTNLGW